MFNNMIARMGHTGVGVRDRTVTKTCIKLPVVTGWDISSDSPLHWIPCQSSLNGQIDEFMHNWGLYYEKENEGSVSSLTVNEWGDEGKLGGGGKERQLLPPVQRTRWGRRRKGCQGEMFDARRWGVEADSAGAPHPAQRHTESAPLRPACDELWGL